MTTAEKKNLRLVQKHLRKMGFKRQYKSGSGSQYYRLELAQPFRAKNGHMSALETVSVRPIDVRISGHAVPWNIARQDALRTWHDNDFSLNCLASHVQCLRWLAWVRQCARSASFQQMAFLNSITVPRQKTFDEIYAQDKYQLLIGE